MQVFSDDGFTSVNIAAFAARRQSLIEHMRTHGEGVAVLLTAPEQLRNRDTHYRFRPDSYFHYLTGFGEPQAALVVIAGARPRSILFCREKNEECEIWEGRCYGPDAAREIFGFDEAYTIGDLSQKLPDLLAGQPVLWCGFGYDRVADRLLGDALNAVRANARAGQNAPRRCEDVRMALDNMRLIKDDVEIAIMRRAAAISTEAHIQAMKSARPGRYEYQVEATLEHAFRIHGSRSPAYPSIVASGPNACILHYVENSRCLRNGDLLLIDAGCELDGYASDISRTFPVGGRFSGAQRDIYEIVLEAQYAARISARPGASWNDPHEAAVKVTTQGLLDLKLLRGSLDEAIERELYRRFYMHRTGHWLGRDVHDAGEYKHNGQWRKLEPGMVFTIEPGCYIRAAEDIPEAFRDIGIRIEDNALITQDGCEYLTENAPRTIADIETLMADR